MSFGICTYNDEKTIEAVIMDCIRASEYIIKSPDLNFDTIYVVSSGSTDNTNHILAKYSNHPKLTIIYETKRNGKSQAINLITETNSSHGLVFIPADVRSSPQAILALISKLARNDSLGAVSSAPSPMLPRNQRSIISSMVTFIWTLHNQTLKATSELGINTHVSGEMMIIRKEFTKPIPKEVINDDAYLGLQVIKSGKKIGFEPRAIVDIDVPITISDYIIQRKRILLGHKQLSDLENQTTSTFRSIFHSNKLLAMRIFLRSITSFSGLVGFISTSIIETYLELSSQRVRQIQNYRFNPIWVRINHAGED